MQTAQTQTQGAAGTVTVQFGSAPAAGDLLVAGIGYQGPAETISAPNGWTIVDDVATGPVGQTTLYHVVQSGESGSYTFYARQAAPMTAIVEDVSGVNTSNPIASRGTNTATTGYSSTTKTLSASNTLPLAFFTQFCNGLEPTYYNGGGWTGQYTVAFSTGYGIAQEAQSGPPGSSAVSATETWQGGDNSAQVNELILFNLGSTAGGGAAAAASVPSHVLSMAFYGLENAGLSPSFMAQNVDMVETPYGGPQGDAFISSGGKYEILYTDPHLVSGCSGTTCNGVMGTTTPETAWLHSSSGARLATSIRQDALNPTSTATQNALAAYVNQNTTGTSVNAVVIDDMWPTYESTYFQYKFGADASEVASQSNPQAYWFAGQIALIGASPKPVFYNGGDGDAPDIAMMTAPNVIGRIVEGCTSWQYWRTNDTQGNIVNRWAASLNKLLDATSRSRYAVCMSYSVTSGDTIGDRIYGMASWWLTYDPTYSVAFPDYNTADGNKIFPEYQIVPTGPLASPGADVANLRSSTGAYVREFSACYQNGTSIGHCAAVVNPSYSSSVSMPLLSQSYSHSLQLGAASVASGGQALFTGAIPASLAPESGLILVQ